MKRAKVAEGERVKIKRREKKGHRKRAGGDEGDQCHQYQLPLWCDVTSAALDNNSQEIKLFL